MPEVSRTLPVHDSGKLPEGLATLSMLRRARRRLAEGQEPVAQLRYHPPRGGGPLLTLLYRVADSVELPPMTPRQRARWEATRTCARCGVLEADPLTYWYDLGGRRQRMHMECVAVERRVRAWAASTARRLAAVAWARQVLADPDVVLFAVHGGVEWPATVHAETLDGRVLVHELVWPARDRWAWPHVGAWDRPVVRPPGALDGELLVTRLGPLVGRRLVHVGVGMEEGALARHWHWDSSPLMVLSGLCYPGWWWSLEAGGAVREVRDDSWPRRLTHWYARHVDQRWPGPGEDSLVAQRPRYADGAEAVAAMREGLRLIAADTEHPDGPAACPARPPGSDEACGAEPTASGMCPDHTREPESAEEDRYG